MTRSVPLMMKVPLSVIRGMSPMYTGCSLMSRIDRAPVSSSRSHTISRRITFKGAAKVMPRWMHSSTSYFGSSSS